MYNIDIMANISINVMHTCIDLIGKGSYPRNITCNTNKKTIKMEYYLVFMELYIINGALYFILFRKSQVPINYG